MGKDIGITVKKSEDFSEWYTQTVIKSELVDYAPVKGLIVLRPDGYSIWESIKSSLDTKFAATGHRNGFLPTLIPESLLSNRGIVIVPTESNSRADFIEKISKNVVLILGKVD